MAISRLSSWTRCFWRMMTTSEAVQVAAASNSSSTGDVAAFASPSTRIAGRPVALPSNCSSCSQRIVTAAVTNSVTAPRGEADVQPVPAHRVHAMILEQPVERRAVMQLETEDSVQPEAGTSWIGPAAVAACHRQPAADVRGGDLLVGGE